MFDIGFSELALCFIVALVVLGPERLPKVARMTGRWTGQARAYMRNLSAELERETHAAEIKKKLEEANRSARAELASLQTHVQTEASAVQKALQPPAEGDSPPKSTTP
jgi:sec-independent protein translocase protein TatB